VSLRIRAKWLGDVSGDTNAKEKAMHSVFYLNPDLPVYFASDSAKCFALCWNAAGPFSTGLSPP
jgi:hypothetical protein